MTALAILIHGGEPHPAAALTLREQQARILFALGVMHYRPAYKHPRKLGEIWATRCFDSIVDEAKRRGFKGRKQLIGAARRGRATPFAMEKMGEACAFLSEAETALELARAASWVHFTETGRLMPGWTFKTPPEASTADIRPGGRGAGL